jgi:hypothetical protein
MNFYIVNSRKISSLKNVLFGGYKVSIEVR